MGSVLGEIRCTNHHHVVRVVVTIRGARVRYRHTVAAWTISLVHANLAALERGSGPDREILSGRLRWRAREPCRASALRRSRHRRGLSSLPMLPYSPPPPITRQRGTCIILRARNNPRPLLALPLVMTRHFASVGHRFRQPSSSKAAIVQADFFPNCRISRLTPPCLTNAVAPPDFGAMPPCCFIEVKARLGQKRPQLDAAGLAPSRHRCETPRICCAHVALR